MNASSACCIAVLALSSCLCACSGAQLGTPMTPLERAHEHAQSLVDDAVEQGFEADESQEIVVFSIRYNPVDECGCPDWEIVYRGRWTRVYADADADDQLVLNALTERAERDLEMEAYLTYRAAGRLEAETTLEEHTGIGYRTFWIVRVEGESDQAEP